MHIWQPPSKASKGDTLSNVIIETGLEKSSAGKLGTFAGVFTPSILTILGIILFLRLGFVIGSSGLYTALLIIFLANMISVLTSFSVAAVATNLKIKGGGDYYLISRTLGLGFGGAIGVVLFLAQSISVGFYAIGFGEATAAVLGMSHGHVVQIIAAIAVSGLFVLAWLGADWATRFQYIIMALIVAALGSFTLGAFDHFSPDQMFKNLNASEGALPFWAAFAIFFPAVTGFTQGVSMSGDLADPGRSIPRGTFWAVGLSIFIYFGVAVLLAGSGSLEVLRSDTGAMKSISAYAPLIIAGVMAATLSSALASFMGAPRILQSLAADNIFSALKPFAEGDGPAKNPRRALILSAAIALGVVAMGNLNLIASVVSMFFLVSYGLLNYATYYEAKANSPSFRPTFRFYDRRLSLLGSVGCLGAMLAIDITSGVVAAAVVLALYQFVSANAPAVRWADSRRSYHIREVRDHLLAAAKEPAHPRDWRPQLLVFSADTERRARLLRFASWIEGGSGLAAAVQVLEGSGPEVLEKREEMIKTLRDEIAAADSDAFPLVVTAPELDPALSTIVQAAGIGPVRANTVLANWIEGVPAVLGHAASGRYSRNLRTAFRLGVNIIVLDADSNEWSVLSQIPANKRQIDVWWRDNKSGELMLLLTYLMTRHEDWAEAKVRVLATPRTNETPEERLQSLTDFFKEARITVEPVILEDVHFEDVIEHSGETPIVFMPFGIHGGRFFYPFGREDSELILKLQIVAMVLAAQDVDLDADPDEISEVVEAEQSTHSETPVPPEANQSA